ncbi:hypothetical protein Q5424_19520 [Conexibacter sp. JD483]|uniref:hypothetical protein n=1 Tax=unclassified Conexibacter TaxID=2627773 RepID=UPI0027264A40|nr:MULTISPECIES: hypothetical protein [unclassified Conexibacter]MDO8185906.1 hypothetical protein [Conexibacter sp. CPCC 205706]MDO8199397.1 hypothetical protein [Conexibacter sp. CPCC 205762]MDR9371297.1 hypothetical protein [Conexibacter sp. JD483]
MATRLPRAPRRSVAVAFATALALLLTCAPAAFADDDARFDGQVTDALRTPAHKLAADSTGRALADLVFVDDDAAGTSYRTCVRRLGKGALRSCFATTSGPAGSPTITPLRFRKGKWAVSWSVAGTVVARWKFAVV